ncbi:hypothetical protein E9531_08320 [Lampropedia puyangensis]|uniref:Uncharacterized protein n=1 Tax=Lampropedia puyangensis TaxID=1330072 RepID=A0A4S8F6X3_9BURK|nr:hypothetical protein [Lampropedia puyangensis]THU01994.1 hypothetical protein E9531_08320 [Lampropedia puyangensis]
MTSKSISAWLLTLTACAGTALFTFFFALTFSIPHWVEEYGAAYIQQEASKRINQRIDGIALPQPTDANNPVSRAAGAIYARNAESITQYKEMLKARVHAKMAESIAQVRNLNCECRKRWEEWLKDGATTQITLLERANQTISTVIHSTYAQVVEGLKKDIRIFTGVNACMFTLVLALSLFKSRATLQLMIPAGLLVVATLVCTYFYIFEQNWLLTIIHNDYLGFAYLGYLSLVFAFLCDIALNRARITTEIINQILSAIGSAANALPC